MTRGKKYYSTSTVRNSIWLDKTDILICEINVFFFFVKKCMIICIEWNNLNKVNVGLQVSFE